MKYKNVSVNPLFTMGTFEHLLNNCNSVTFSAGDKSQTVSEWREDMLYGGIWCIVVIWDINNGLLS